MITDRFLSVYKILIPLTVLIIAILLQDKFDVYNIVFRNFTKSKANGVFTTESLAKYDGVTKKKLYVGVLGIIFDVSKSQKHYGKDASYHYFVGKDGSRSLVTGDFKDESANKDHVLDMPCADILTLLYWRESFEKKYKKIGVLEGRYYDNYGQKTGYLEEFGRRVEQCQREKEADKQLELKYPPCNIAWSEEDGTKVWCTTTSGGINRHWVGVPRQLFIPGEKSPKCVCIDADKEQHNISEGLIKEYSNCAHTSTVCYVES